MPANTRSKKTSTDKSIEIAEDATTQDDVKANPDSSESNFSEAETDDDDYELSAKSKLGKKITPDVEIRAKQLYKEIKHDPLLQNLVENISFTDITLDRLVVFLAERDVTLTELKTNKKKSAKDIGDFFDTLGVNENKYLISRIWSRLHSTPLLQEIENKLFKSFANRDGMMSICFRVVMELAETSETEKSYRSILERKVAEGLSGKFSTIPQSTFTRIIDELLVTLPSNSKVSAAEVLEAIDQDLALKKLKKKHGRGIESIFVSFAKLLSDKEFSFKDFKNNKQKAAEYIGELYDNRTKNKNKRLILMVWCAVHLPPSFDRLLNSLSQNNDAGIIALKIIVELAMTSPDFNYKKGLENKKDDKEFQRKVFGKKTELPKHEKALYVTAYNKLEAGLPALSSKVSPEEIETALKQEPLLAKLIAENQLRGLDDALGQFCQFLAEGEGTTFELFKSDKQISAQRVKDFIDTRCPKNCKYFFFRVWMTFHETPLLKTMLEELRKIVPTSVAFDHPASRVILELSAREKAENKYLESLQSPEFALPDESYKYKYAKERIEGWLLTNRHLHQTEGAVAKDALENPVIERDITFNNLLGRRLPQQGLMELRQHLIDDVGDINKLSNNVKKCANSLLRYLGNIKYKRKSDDARRVAYAFWGEIYINPWEPTLKKIIGDETFDRYGKNIRYLFIRLIANCGDEVNTYSIFLKSNKLNEGLEDDIKARTQAIAACLLLMVPPQAVVASGRTVEEANPLINSSLNLLSEIRNDEALYSKLSSSRISSGTLLFQVCHHLVSEGINSLDELKDLQNIERVKNAFVKYIEENPGAKQGFQRSICTLLWRELDPASLDKYLLENNAVLARRLNKRLENDDDLSSNDSLSEDEEELADSEDFPEEESDNDLISMDVGTDKATAGEASQTAEAQLPEAFVDSSVLSRVEDRLKKLNQIIAKAQGSQDAFEDVSLLKTFTDEIYNAINTFGNATQGSSNILDNININALITGLRTAFEELNQSSTDEDIQSISEDIVGRINRMLQATRRTSSRTRSAMESKAFSACSDSLYRDIGKAMTAYAPDIMAQDAEGDTLMLDADEATNTASTRSKGKGAAIPYRLSPSKKRTRQNDSGTVDDEPFELKRTKRQKANTGTAIPTGSAVQKTDSTSPTYDEKHDRQLQFACVREGQKIKSIKISFSKEDEEKLQEDIAGRFRKAYGKLSPKQKDAVDDRIEELRKKLEDQYRLALEGKSPFDGLVKRDNVGLKDVHHNEIGPLVLNPNNGLRKVASSSDHKNAVEEVESLGFLAGEELTKEAFDQRVKENPELLHSPFVVEVSPTKYMIINNLLGLGNAPAHFDPAVGSYVYREEDVNAVFRGATASIEIENEDGSIETVDERIVWVPGFDIKNDDSIVINYGPYYLELLNRSYLKQMVELYSEEHMGEWLEAYEKRSQRLIEGFKKGKTPALQCDDAYMPWMMAGLNAKHDGLNGEVFDSVEALQAKLNQTPNNNTIRGVIRLSHTHYVTLNIFKDAKGNLTTQVLEPANRDEYLSGSNVDRDFTALEKVLCRGEKDRLLQLQVRSQKTLQECGIHTLEFLPLLKEYEPYFEQLMEMQMKGQDIPKEAPLEPQGKYVSLKDRKLESMPLDPMEKKVQKMEDCRELLPPDFYKHMTDVRQIKRAKDRNNKNKRWDWNAPMKDGLTIDDYIKSKNHPTVKNLKYYTTDKKKDKWPEIEEAQLSIFRSRLELIKGARRQYEISRALRPHRLRKELALVSLALNIEAEASHKNQSFADTFLPHQYQYKPYVIRRMGEEFTNPSRAALLEKKRVLEKAIVDTGLSSVVPLPFLKKPEVLLTVHSDPEVSMSKVSSIPTRKSHRGVSQKTWAQVRQEYEAHTKPGGKFQGDAKYEKYKECIDDFMLIADKRCPMDLSAHELVAKMQEWFFSKEVKNKYKHLHPTPAIALHHLAQTLHTQYRFDLYKVFAERVVPDEKRNELVQLESYYKRSSSTPKDEPPESLGYQDHIKIIYSAMMEAWNTKNVLDDLKKFQHNDKVLAQRMQELHDHLQVSSRFKRQDEATQRVIQTMAKKMGGFTGPDDSIGPASGGLSGSRRQLRSSGR